jgi:hypothetical protein
VSVLDKDFSKAKQPNFAGMSKTPADNLSVQQNVSRSDIYYDISVGRVVIPFQTSLLQDQLDTVANLLI